MAQNNLSKEEEDILLTVIGEKIESIDNLMKEQKKHCDESKQNTSRLYSIGLYNGLALANSVLTGEKPRYYE